MIDQHANLAEKFVKKGFWLYLFSFIIAPLSYIIKIIISGELSVSEIGILYGIVSLLTLFAAYNDLGLTDSLNYFIPKYIQEKRYDKVKTILVYTIIAQLITGSSIAAFFYFGAEFISQNYFESMQATQALKIFAFFFLGVNIFQVIATFFMSIQNTFYNKVTEFLRTIFILASCIFILVSDIGSLTNYSYTWIIGLYGGILCAVFLFFKKYYLPYLKDVKVIWSFALFSEIFKYSLSIFLGIQAGVILSQIDMQMILAILGTTDAGYYTTYLSVIGIPFMILGPIFAFLYPLFSELQSKGETDKIRFIKSVFQKSFTGVALAFSIFFFIFAEKIVFILFGEKFLPSAIILQYSILFLSFNFLMQINFNIMAGVGKVKERVKIVFIAIFINTSMNFILIHLLGVYGAALASGIGWMCIWLLSEKYLGKSFRIAFELGYLFKNILIFSMLGGVLFYCTKNISLFETRIGSLLLLTLISSVYFGTFFFLHKKDIDGLVIQIKRIKRQ